MSTPDLHDRELMLSLFLDGELTPEQRQGVEQLIRTDPQWRSDYEELVATEAHISKVVENNWHDSDLTDRIIEQVRKLPKPSSTTAQAAQARAAAAVRQQAASQQPRPAALPAFSPRRLGWWATAAALLFLGLGLRQLLAPAEPHPFQAPGEVLASVQAGTALLQPGIPGIRRAETEKTLKLQAGDLLTAQADPTQLAWSDGSRFWLRPGSKVTADAPRQLTLQGGALYAAIAPKDQPFRIALPDGSKVEALGTAFEITLGRQGTSVRVVEGHVRKISRTLALVEARGGQEIGVDSAVLRFDPREVQLAWSAADRPLAAPVGAALWGQLGGAPGHGGSTPLRGPQGQLAAAEFFPYPDPQPGPQAGALPPAPAVIHGDGRLYIVRPSADQKSRLFRLDPAAGKPAWEPCGPPLEGRPYQSPAVISARGLVVFGTSANRVQAWDPILERVAWEADLEHSVWGLCAAHDGRLYCSVFGGLVALEEGGRIAWRFMDRQEMTGPAAVLDSGEIELVFQSGSLVRLTRNGELARRVDLKGESSFPWPPVAGDGGKTYVGARAGALQAVLPDGGLSLLAAEAETWPLGNGMYAERNQLRFNDTRRIALHLDGPITALARDGQGAVFASIRNVVYRLADPLRTPEPRPVYAETLHGEVVRGGIAVLPGRLVVTTSEGVQVFK